MSTRSSKAVLRAAGSATAVAVLVVIVGAGVTWW